MNEISSEFKIKLDDEVYDSKQVYKLLLEIQKCVQSTVSHELDLMTRMNILLLQQVLTPDSDIKWGHLEDEHLLNKIREFEQEEFNLIQTQRQRVTIDESRVKELELENSNLKSELKNLQLEIDKRLENSNAVKSLLGILERKNILLKKLSDKLQFEDLELNF